MFKRLLVIVCFILPMISFAENFIAGKDYEDLGAANIPKTKTVIEFFSYGCPWCFRLQPSITKWHKADAAGLEFTKVPVIFHKPWSYYAKAFYVIQSQGLNDKLDPVLFKAIQTDKLTLNSNDAMIDFLSAQGLDKQFVRSAFTQSPTMDLKIADANRTMADYRINSVPTFVINQRYKTDLKMAASEERLFKIIDYLLSKNN